MNAPVPTALLLLAIALPAQADRKLADSKNCLACHGMKEAVVGPAFKDVAAKYAARPDADKYLATKIKQGSTGVWGPVAMPANDVTDEQAAQLAAWVLTLK